MNFVIYIENLAPNGIASQSTTCYLRQRKIHLTADLAITGGSTDTLVNGGCAMTSFKPPQPVAWWMLSFPVDEVYVTNVKIYYSKFS